MRLGVRSNKPLQPTAAHVVGDPEFKVAQWAAAAELFSLATVSHHYRNCG